MENFIRKANTNEIEDVPVKSSNSSLCPRPLPGFERRSQVGAIRGRFFVEVFLQ